MRRGQVELHPRNSGFVWREHEGPYRLVSPEQAEAFDRDGYFLLEQAIDRKRVAAVRNATDELEAEHERSLRARGGQAGISRAGEITFTAHLVRHDVLRGFAASQPFVDLSVDLLGGDVRLYWDQAVYKKPETARPFPWHQDTAYHFTEPQDYLTCWIPLVDATVENGCPWVAPGMHGQGTIRHWDSPIGLVCKEGDEARSPSRRRSATSSSSRR